MGDILDRHTRKHCPPLAAWIFLLLFSPAGKLFPAEITPVSIGHANDGGNAFGVAVAGHFAYLANFDDGLRIYDISNPTNPVSVGHINNGFAAGVAISDNLACVADSADGLRIYDISNPTNPVSVGHTNNGASASGVALAGNFACLANNGDGLRIYDISNPANPVNIGHAAIGISGNASSVAVAGNFAYLANNGDGLRIYDISNPANPVNVGSANDLGIAFGVAVAGTDAYLADGFEGLRVYDTSTPASPLGIGQAATDAGNAVAVTVSNNYAYLANFDDGLHIYNISNPSNPVPVAAINDGGFARGIAVSGNYAYLANGSDGLRVYLLQPELSIAIDANNNLVITWPAPSTSWILQQDSTGDGDWVPVNTLPTVAAAQNQVVIPQPSGSANFRLQFIPPQPPTLAITLSDPNTAVISWPVHYPGFVLQQNADLSTSNWTIVPNPPDPSTGTNQVTITPLAGNMSYRLVFLHPQLTMSMDSTGITLSWPSYFAGFTPQQTDNPIGTNWTTIPGTPFTVGGQYQVHVPQTTPNQFFRLISQQVAF